MKKKNFITMVLGTVGGILFGVGMCMCLLAQWNAINQGIVVACIGIVVLVGMVLVRRKMEHKPPIQLNVKTIGTIAFGMVGTLVLGIGMCMVMVWEGLLLQGIVIGTVGILALMSLIPICKGIQ